MSLLRMNSRLLAIAIMVSIPGCHKDDNEESHQVESVPPNTCKAFLNLGTFPSSDGSNVSTWAYVCMEGIDRTFTTMKTYFAEKCMDATDAPGFEFVKLESPSCPVDGATSICEGPEFKIVAYKQDPEHFDLEKFRKYCESKHGALKILQ